LFSSGPGRLTPPAERAISEAMGSEAMRKDFSR
jgi:hypothetical protein